MFSQKSLSHSSRMAYAAPSLRLFVLPLTSRFFDELLVSASSLADVKAARGGLDGGEINPERTSGIPLCPAGAGSGVVESREARRGIDDIAAGEDVGLSTNHLAATITTTSTVFHTWRHCAREMPGLRCEIKVD